MQRVPASGKIFLDHQAVVYFYKKPSMSAWSVFVGWVLSCKSLPPPQSAPLFVEHFLSPLAISLKELCLPNTP